jgi:hypothetical protein
LFALVGFGHGGQTILYKTHRRTSDNTMAKTNKEKQSYRKHIEERQTIPSPKPRRKNNVSLLILVMLLSDVLQSVLYNIVCPCWFWPWYCLTFFDVFSITLFVLVCFGHGIEERQTIPSPKPRRKNNVI